MTAHFFSRMGMVLVVGLLTVGCGHGGILPDRGAASPGSGWLPRTRLSPTGAEVLFAGRRELVIRSVDPTGLGKTVHRLSVPGWVTDATYSPDGKMLVVSSKDGKASVWSAASGKKIWEKELHKDGGSYVAFSSDGKQLLTAGSDTVLLLDVGSQAILQTWTKQENITDVSFSPGGQYVLIVANGEAQVMDAVSGKKRQGIRPVSAGIRSAAFSPDGKHLVLGSYNGSVFTWNVERNDAETYLGWHTDAIATVQFSPDGKRALSSGGDGSTVVWDVKEERKEVILPAEPWSSWVERPTFAVKAPILVAAAGDSARFARLWGVNTGLQVGQVAADSGVVSIDIAPDGKKATLLSLDRRGIKVTNVDAGTGATVAQWTEPTHVDVSGVVWDSSGSSMWALSEKGVVQWNAADGEVWRSIARPYGGTAPGSRSNKGALSSKGSHLIIPNGEGVMLVALLQNSERVISTPGLGVVAAGMDDMAQRVVVRGWTKGTKEDGEKVLWLDAISGKTVGEMMLPKDVAVRSCSTTELRCVTLNKSGGVHIWDGKTGKLAQTLVQQLKPASAEEESAWVTFLDDGKRVVVWDRAFRHLRMFASDTGKHLYTVHISGDQWVYSLDLQRDRLFILTNTGVVYALNAQTGKTKFIFREGEARAASAVDAVVTIDWKEAKPEAEPVAVPPTAPVVAPVVVSPPAGKAAGKKRPPAKARAAKK